jgi:pimeloyl-ACP methyl ester carboxylesterase
VGCYVHESGAPGSPAVVFLHAAGVSGRMWREQMRHLSGFHCLAPDFPGFGRSNQLPWKSRTDAADRVADLIKTRIPAQRAHVVGLSLGASVAHTLVARHPDLVDRVVIDGCGILRWWGNGLFLLGIAATSPFLRTRPVMEAISRAIGFDAEGQADLRAASRRAFLRAFADAFKTPITREEMTAQCANLLVAGEDETLVRRSNAAQASLMPHAEARFAPGLGHGWLAKKPDLHVQMVEAWLTGQELPSELEPEGTPSPSAVAQMRHASSVRGPARAKHRPAH